MTATPPVIGPTIASSTIAAVRDRIQGAVIVPADPEYEGARRVWNGMIDRRPAIIVRCAGTADVAATIELAREHHLPLAVRGGGHSAAGFGVCDGGVVLDLGAIRSIEVDPVNRRARAGGGATWADLDSATQAYGLAVTGGLVTHTGIGGLTLGGGIGNLMRRCGLTSDNLRAADVVTAAGEVIRVAEDDHQDLLWGLRGGGGNFGVVTQFDYGVHEIGPTVVAGAVMYPLRAADEVLRFYREWAPALPDEMTTIVALRGAPPSPHIPTELHGSSVLAIAVCWSGPLDQADAALEPLRRFKRPLVDSIKPRPYLEHQSMFDASAPPGRQNYKRNSNVGGLPNGLIDVLVDFTEKRTSPMSLTLIFQFGGAVARVAEGATAFSDRTAAYNIDINAQWLEAGDPRRDEHVRWVRDFGAALQPFGTGGTYVNFLMDDEGKDRVRSTYGHEKHRRLVSLKRRYDPDNVFRLNQNIRPGEL